MSKIRSMAPWTNPAHVPWHMEGQRVPRVDGQQWKTDANLRALGSGISSIVGGGLIAFAYVYRCACKARATSGLFNSEWVLPSYHARFLAHMCLCMYTDPWFCHNPFFPEATMTSTLAAAIGVGTSIGPSASLLDNTFHSGQWLIYIYIYIYNHFMIKRSKLLSLPPSSTPLMKPCRNGLDGIRTLNQLILIDRLFFLDEGWRYSWLAPCPKQAGHLPMPTCMTCFCLFKSVLILPILHLFGVCLYPPFWSGILLVSVTGVVRNWCLVW